MVYMLDGRPKTTSWLGVEFRDRVGVRVSDRIGVRGRVGVKVKDHIHVSAEHCLLSSAP